MTALATGCLACSGHADFPN